MQTTLLQNLRTWVFLAFICWLSTSAGAYASGPVFTNHDVFYLPFSADSVESDATSTAEVALFASGDQGATWHAYQRQPLHTGRFSFRAGADGEFWFVVRNAEITEVPADTAPELRVVVDRQAPALDIQVKHVADGSAHIQWTVSDPSLAATPPQLEYRSTPESTWRFIRGQFTMNHVGRDRQGVIIWAAPPVDGLVQLRATATDLAGNRQVVERSLVLAAAQPGANSDDFELSALPAVPPAKSSSSAAIQNPFVTESGPPTTNPSTSPPTQNEPGGDWHSSNGDPSAMLTLLEPPATGMPNPMAHQPPTWKAPQARNHRDAAPPALPPRQDDAGSSLFRPSPPQQQIEMPVTSPGASSEWVDSSMSSSTHRTSGSRRFQLEYVIENNSADGVHRVEVWFTNDDGRSWRHYGDDADRQSPFQVEVPDDGLYGFRLIVQGREGLVAQAPRSGDEPDVWINVDSVTPVARLTSAKFGHGEQAGRLIITWDARDAMLVEHPISLFFGETVSGPWRKIAQNLPNAGHYSWRFDDRVPTQFHLRLEAIDQAGNVGLDVLKNPIRRDGFTPQGTIRNVRPVDDPQ